MACLSVFVGVRGRVEALLWGVWFAAWVWAVVRFGVAAPFLTVLLGSVIAGVSLGLLQALWLETYRRRNPWHAKRLDESRGHLAFGFVSYGLGAGTFFGAVVGAIAWAASRYFA